MQRILVQGLKASTKQFSPRLFPIDLFQKVQMEKRGEKKHSSPTIWLSTVVFYPKEIFEQKEEHDKSLF